MGVESSRIGFWRTSIELGVDFVIEKKPNIFPFAVTCIAKIQNNKVKNLVSFLADEPRAKVG